MPFNGEGTHYPTLTWTHQRILAELQIYYPDLQVRKTEPHATATRYQVPGHVGTLGIIAAYTRTFCGSCNRIRLTAQGTLKTCLYDNGVLDVRALLRSHTTDADLTAAFLTAFAHRPLNGFEAEASRQPVTESMATIGG